MCQQSSLAKTMLTSQMKKHHSPRKPMIFLKNNWIAPYKYLKVEVRTQIYWRKMRLKSCSTLIWTTKRSFQKLRWRKTKMKTKMVKAKSATNPILCFSTSTPYAKITHCFYSLQSIASHRCSQTSLSNSCSKSTRCQRSQVSDLGTTQWAPTASLTTFTSIHSRSILSSVKVLNNSL